MLLSRSLTLIWYKPRMSLSSFRIISRTNLPAGAFGGADFDLTISLLPASKFPSQKQLLTFLAFRSSHALTGCLKLRVCTDKGGRICEARSTMCAKACPPSFSMLTFPLTTYRTSPTDPLAFQHSIIASSHCFWEKLVAS